MNCSLVSRADNKKRNLAVFYFYSVTCNPLQRLPLRFCFEKESLSVAASFSLLAVSALVHSCFLSFFALPLEFHSPSQLPVALLCSSPSSASQLMEFDVFAKGIFGSISSHHLKVVEQTLQLLTIIGFREVKNFLLKNSF